jgi:hypothetical protein
VILKVVISTLVRLGGEHGWAGMLIKNHIIMTEF